MESWAQSLGPLSCHHQPQGLGTQLSNYECGPFAHFTDGETDPKGEEVSRPRIDSLNSASCIPSLSYHTEGGAGVCTLLGDNWRPRGPGTPC